MIKTDDALLLASLKEHEGWRDRMYKCSAGKWTIGYGHNLEDKPISMAVGAMMLMEDVAESVAEAYQYNWLFDSPKEVQRVVIEMIYQLGAAGFFKFIKTRAALARRDYQGAAGEMLDSAWAKQTPARAHELAAIVRRQ